MLRNLIRIPRRHVLGSVALANRRISSKAEEVVTRLNDPADPGRNQFFQYNWGSWLKSNTLERAKRETRFNIENLASFLKSFKVHESTLVKPETLDNGITILSNNWTKEIIGEGNYGIKTISSIHEGKHHRIYKVTSLNEKNFVLRVPYKLESDFAIENKIKSEVATLDFLSLKLMAKVPKVIAYGCTRSNPLQTPFIMMEYVEGELMMKSWDPMVPDSEESSSKLNSVVDPIMDFTCSALSITFNRYGSLYFFDDVNGGDQSVVPYEDEEKDEFAGRWRIGASVERAFSRNKKHLSARQIAQYNGPWDADKPLDMISDVASLELESLKTRLSLAQADSSSQVENIPQLKQQIETFEHLKLMSHKLLNPYSKSIMNVEEIFKPRLYFPDLDPLNVIVDGDKPTFVDFEHANIKPFILTTYPSFVAYQGVKIYNLEEDIPEFDTMDEDEKQQYLFMYYKTRNERLWEHALNKRRHDLIAIASPHVKVLKAPYVQALDCKTDKDYLFVENAIIQLQAMWNVYVANGMVNTDEPVFPIEYTQEKLDEHQAVLEQHQAEVASKPFAATGGWIPQDMFEVLKDQGILVAGKNGDYEIKVEAALRDAPQKD